MLRRRMVCRLSVPLGNRETRKGRGPRFGSRAAFLPPLADVLERFVLSLDTLRLGGAENRP